MQINPYLNFNGNCEEAFQYYEQNLGGKITGLFRHEGTPMAAHVPAEWLNKIMHVTLSVGDQVIMGSDAPPDRYGKPQGFAVSLGIPKIADAERVFAALSEGGTVQMPIQQTFWAVRFGMVTDRFGIPWMINCEKGE